MKILINFTRLCLHFKESDVKSFLESLKTSLNNGALFIIPIIVSQKYVL